MQNKKRFPLVPVLIFVLLFAGVVYYGYTHFFRKQTKAVPATSGLNSQLPAVAETKDLNKLELYMQAEKDSAALKEQRQNDPYNITENEHPASETGLPKYRPAGEFQFVPLQKNRNTETELSEKNIDRQLQQIYQSLHSENNSNAKQPTSLTIPDTVKPTTPVTVPTDPELKQLEGMLDKLIDIQHPELVKQRYSKKDSGDVMAGSKPRLKNAVTAVVHNTQLLSNGSTIKLRLTQDMVLGEETIPKGNFLYGTCSLYNERLTVQLTNLTYRNEVIPVFLSVYDVDGIEGIYVPGAIARDVAKEGSEQAVQSFTLNSYDPSLTGQVASAGLQATKSLLSKKLKLVRVTVKAGHHLLLQNTHGY